MYIVEAMLVLLLLICGVIVSISDIKNGIISNKILVLIILLSIPLNCLYYYFIPKLINIYIINLIIISIFSFSLYATHIWGGGDSKYLILIGFLLPTRVSIFNNSFLIGIIIIPMLSFMLSFIYLIIDSIIQEIKNKKLFYFNIVKKEFKIMITRYLINIVYIILIIKVEKLLLGEKYTSVAIFLVILNCCILFVISSFRVFSKIYLCIALLMASFVISFLSGTWILNKERVFYYLLTMIVMFIRTLISQYNYSVIDTNKVKKGMVLSTVTTMLFVESKIKGLPGISKEDLRSKLTQEEVESIIQWEKSKYGTKQIQIIRKVPFAIFMTLGIIIYLIIWRILHGN